MNSDMFLLVSGGLAALFAAALVTFLSPGRFVAIVAGACLATFGLLEFGFARAVFERAEWGALAWFDRSLALALPVSALWVLLSVALGRTSRDVNLGPWRFYLAAQAVVSLAALWAVSAGAPRIEPVDAIRAAQFSLTRLDRTILWGILINLLLLSGNFEATHLSLPRRYRRAFRPALWGVLLTAGAFTYLFASSLVAGHMDVDDLSLGAVPLTLLSLLLPLSLIRGRVAEARIARARLPITATMSILITSAFLIGTSGSLWLTRALGISFARGLFILATGGIAVAVGALAVSNRLRRRVQRVLDPIWYERDSSRRAVAARVVAPIERAESLEEACAKIPGNARDLSGLEPVTLFLAQRNPDSFRSVGSTLDPQPSVTVPDDAPLTVELRRAQRPIRLRGRTDDLEYVSIYVENAEQISACAAACAVPLTGEEDLVGFLFCGTERKGSGISKDSLALLHCASRRYAAVLERMIDKKFRIVNE